MTKQDYILIAQTIKDMCDARDNGETLMTREGIAATFADRLAGTNQRFNRATFLKACGA